MIHSMTGYASGQGMGLGHRWTWELRAVNGKGLDLRLRVPDWIDGLEAALRPLLAKAAARGNVSLSLRVQRDDGEGGLRLNTSQLETVLSAMSEVEARAMDQGLSLAPSTAAQVVGLRGILDQTQDPGDLAPLKAHLLAELPALIAAFGDMRAREGKALEQVLTGQLDEVHTLTEACAGLLDTRADKIEQTLRTNLARIVETTGADEARVAQELAILAVKSDVTEEIDRLRAHVVAARELIAHGGAIGRKFDFLMQEFNREANTLCSKAQMTELTENGLALKVVIDQMREQVQNVE